MMKSKADEEDYWNSSKFNAFTFDDADDELSRVRPSERNQNSGLMLRPDQYIMVRQRDGICQSEDRQRARLPENLHTDAISQQKPVGTFSEFSVQRISLVIGRLRRQFRGCSKERGFIPRAGVQADGSETLHPLLDRNRRAETAAGAAQV
ncbi:hypothetical protein GOODEAATRI_010509 [Goodea atripinnis]|uniref:Uncharacterized protein n=1 Tax=Goodea atripinnis TaxID=208336 RepID=A0ABV0PWW0_9TELE